MGILRKKLGSIKRRLKRAIYTESTKRALLGHYVRKHNTAYAQISRLAKQLEGGTHPKHRIMNYPQFFVDNVEPTDTVLDLGHGTGHISYKVAEKAKFVTGIDITNKRKESGKENVEFIAGDATTYQFNQTFDKIILSNVLEHIDERVAFLEKLKPLSDTILLRVPMITRDWVAYYKREQGFEYRLDSTHFIEYTLEDLEDELTQSGWRLDSYKMNWGELWGVVKKNK